MLAEKRVMDGAGARINHQQKLQFPHVPVAVQGQRSHTCGRLLLALSSTTVLRQLAGKYFRHVGFIKVVNPWLY